MTFCVKCKSTEDLKLLNFFTFHRNYGFDESPNISSPLEASLPLEAYKEFTRREFLKDMDKHFEDFWLEILCGNCVSAFEWDFGRSWEHYSKEGLELRANVKEHLDRRK